MTNFHSTSNVASTRKPHVCEQCGKLIEVGSAAKYSVGNYYGDFYRHYEHVECHAAGMAYAEMTGYWGDEYTWFQHGLNDRDDADWLLRNHPIVAGRLGLTHEAAE